MKKQLLIFLLGIFLISLVYASQDSLGTFKQNEQITLIQICGTCTYNNITSIVLPNSTHLTIDTAMTKRGMEYTYTFNQTDLIGTYLVNGIGDLDGTANAWAYELNINLMGEQLTEAKAILYVIIIFISLIFLSLTIWGAWAFPFKNNRDEEGRLVSINDFKYLKIFMWLLSYLELLFISFLLRNLSGGYLANGGFYELFNIIFNILLILSLPFFPLLIYFTIIIWLNDKKLIDKLNRGFDV